MYQRRFLAPRHFLILTRTEVGTIFPCGGVSEPASSEVASAKALVATVAAACEVALCDMQVVVVEAKLLVATTAAYEVAPCDL